MAQFQSRLRFKPGINPEPDTTAQNTVYCIDGDNIRFYRGRPQKIGGHLRQTLIGAALTGVPRTDFTYQIGTYQYHVVWTHKGLYIIKNGTAYNMTPLKTSGTALANKIATSSGQPTVTINQTAHGFTPGNRIKISGASDVGGFTAASQINREHIITSVTDANNYVLTLSSNASSTVAAGGGSFTVYGQIDPGVSDAALATGWGVDGANWNTGFTWAETQTGTTYTRPRVAWCDLFGTILLTGPGNLGGAYKWDGSSANAMDTAPTLITNAPTQCNWGFVDGTKLVLLGAYSSIDTNQKNNRFTSSDTGDYTAWPQSPPVAGSNAYEDVKEDASYLMCNLKVGEEHLIFDEQGPIFRTRYIGGAEKWLWERVSTNHRLIGPNACIEIAGLGYFVGTDNIYYYNGGTVEPIPNNTLLRYMFDSINLGQGYKVTLEYLPKYQELRVYYPSADATENDRCVIYNLAERIFYKRTISRTATERHGHPLNGRVYALDATPALYEHEVGFNDHTSAMTSFVRLAFTTAGSGSRTTIIEGLEPDAILTGTLSAKLYTKLRPSDTEALAGTLSITGSTATAYFDPAKTARYWAWEFSQSQVDGFFQIDAFKEMLRQGGYS